MNNVFVSFDYENDKRYKFLLEAWSKNKLFTLSFNDVSSGEIDSINISRVKAALTVKIKSANVVLVIIGKFANALHRDSIHIGERNWINWEIARGKEMGKRIVAVKIDNAFTSPEKILNSNASWARVFSEDAITKALMGY